MNTRDSSIQQKLIRIIVVVTATVLLTSSTFILIVDFFLLRQATARGLAILADAVAYNSSAALAFEDREDGRRILEAFRAESNVRDAVLYDEEGEVFAEYGDGPAGYMHSLALPEEKPVYQGGVLYYATPVTEGEGRLGTLVIRYDLSALQGRLQLYLLIVLVTVAAALLIAYFLARLLQGGISRPLRALEETARAISDRHDYSIRAVKTTGDEVGKLTDAFNEMLDRIAEKEAALRVSSDRLRIAVEASRTGVWDWDLKTGSIEWVGSLYDSLGLPEGKTKDLREEKFTDSVHPDDRGLVDRMVARAADPAKGRLQVDFRMIGKDGETRYVRSVGKTYFDEGKEPMRMVGVIIDVTDLRIAEAEIRDLNRNLERRVADRTAELSQALHEIEAFSYSVSHDLRAPLRAINGFSQALMDDYQDKIDGEGRDFLQRIVASCQRMGQLIDDLLELSRVTRREMRGEPVDLSTLAREIASSLRSSSPERRVKFQIEDNLTVLGDSNLLGIALENLIRNAWKFSGQKEEAFIEVGRTTEKGEEAFFVRDNGAGFDMAFVDKLFGVFQRLHPAGEFEGTGIGLATVRRIIERHGGKVWAAGELNRGATFYFTVPHIADIHEKERHSAGGRQP